MKAAFACCLCLFLFASGAARAEGEPSLLFSTYLGGGGLDEAWSLAVDTSGGISVVGRTDSTNFPVVGGLGNPEGEEEQIRDAFLFRLTPTGDLVFSTYFGEPLRDDFAQDVAIDAAGTAYVAGVWLIPLWRTVGFWLKRVDAGGVSPDLVQEQGDEYDSVEHLAIAPDGTVYLTGFTCSLFIFGIDRSDRPTCEGFLLASDGRQGYEWALLLPWKIPQDVTVDAAGNVYLAGSADSYSNNVFSYDVFVAKIDPSGKYLYTTVFGGTRNDIAFGIDLDDAGNTYVTGATRSSDFPVAGGVQRSHAGESDAFVAKLDLSGALVYSTYLGGARNDVGYGIAVEASGGAMTVVGTTWSPGFPQRNSTAGPCPDLCGPSDAFITRLDPSGSQVVFSTLLGGTSRDEGRGIQLDLESNLVVTGWTDSLDFPTVNAVQPDLAGASDAFVAKIGFAGNRPPDCSAATASPSVIWPPNGKMVPVSILSVTDPDGDPVTLKITGITQDEPGAAYSGIGSSAAQVKAERDGKGDGRVYRILFEASDPSGASCTGEVTVCVPHDQGGADLRLAS